MVEVKYIKRAGKLHGPYYYKSVRDPDGSVRKIYLGKTNPESVIPQKKYIRKSLDINPLNLLVIVVIFLALIGLFFFFKGFPVTGQYIVSVNKMVSSNAYLEVDGISQAIPLELTKVGEDWYYNITYLDLNLTVGIHTLKIIDNSETVFEQNVLVGENGGAGNETSNETVGNETNESIPPPAGFDILGGDYGIQATTLTQCQQIAASGDYILDRNVGSAGTCFNISANDVSLNCNGYTINYSQSAVGYGINISGFHAVVRNCRINHTDSSYGNSHGIYLEKTWNVTLDNVFVNTIGDQSSAIRFSEVNNSWLNNSVVRGNGTDNWVVYVTDTKTCNFNNNSINVSSGAIALGGIAVLDSGTYNNYTRNTILTEYENSVFVPLGTNGLIANNTIKGGPGGGTAILFLGTNTKDYLVTQNTIYSPGGSSAIMVNDLTYGYPFCCNVIDNNIINNSGNGIYLQNTSYWNITNNNIYSNNIGIYTLSAWNIRIDGGNISSIKYSLFITNYSSVNVSNAVIGYNSLINNSYMSFLNSSFVNISSIGVLNFSSVLHYDNVTVVNNIQRNLSSNFTIGNNFISVDSQSSPEFNVTANLTFYIAPGYNTVSMLRNDTPCSDVICKNKVYNKTTGVLTVDVMYFTNYSTAGDSCLNLSDSNTWLGRVSNISSQNFNISQNVSLCLQDYNFNGTLAGESVFYLNTSNTVFNCNGSRLIGNISNSAQQYLRVGNDNITVKNCVFMQSGSNDVIYARKGTSNLIHGIIILNNTFINITDDGTESVACVRMDNASYAYVINNTVDVVRGSGDSHAYAFSFPGLPISEHILVQGNNITTVYNTQGQNERAIAIFSDTSGYIGYPYVNNITIINNIISNVTYGIYFIGGNVNISYNNITNKLNGVGILASGFGTTNQIYHNYISNVSTGIYLGFPVFSIAAYNYSITDNIIPNASLYNIYLWNTTNTSILRNLINNSMIGIFLNYSQNNSIMYNNISSVRTGVFEKRSFMANYYYENNLSNIVKYDYAFGLNELANNLDIGADTIAWYNNTFSNLTGNPYNFITVGNSIVAVNSTGLPTQWNSSANVSLSVSCGSYSQIYYNISYQTTLANIVRNGAGQVVASSGDARCSSPGSCDGISCVNNILNMNISNFSSYGVDSCVNLTDSSTFGTKVSYYPAATQNFVIQENTVLCRQPYQFNGSISSISILWMNYSNVVLDCNGAYIVGNGSTGSRPANLRTHNITVKNCNFWNYSASLMGSADISSSVAGSKILNNNFTNFNGANIAAIRADNFSDMVIANNIITNFISSSVSTEGAYGIILLGRPDVRNVIVENNTFDGIYTAASSQRALGIGIYNNDLLPITPISNITLTGNIFRNITSLTAGYGAGIHLLGVNSTLQRNNLSNIDGIGIGVFGDYIYLYNNSVINSTYGVAIDSVLLTATSSSVSSHNIIKQNHLLNSTSYGIYANNASNLTISFNNITTGNTSIYILDGNNVNISYNNITYFTRGIVVVGNGNSSNIHKNFINNASYGILIGDTSYNLLTYNYSVSDNVINGAALAGASGIGVDYAYNINVLRNIINGTYYGLSVINSSYVYVLDNNITEPNADAIYISGNNNILIKNNKFSMVNSFSRKTTGILGNSTSSINTTISYNNFTGFSNAVIDLRNMTVVEVRHNFISNYTNTTALSFFTVYNLSIVNNSILNGESLYGIVVLAINSTILEFYNNTINGTRVSSTQGPANWTIFVLDSFIQPNMTDITKYNNITNFTQNQFVKGWSLQMRARDETGNLSAVSVYVYNWINNTLVNTNVSYVSNTNGLTPAQISLSAFSINFSVTPMYEYKLNLSYNVTGVEVYNITFLDNVTIIANTSTKTIYKNVTANRSYLAEAGTELILDFGMPVVSLSVSPASIKKGSSASVSCTGSDYSLTGVSVSGTVSGAICSNAAPVCLRNSCTAACSGTVSPGGSEIITCTGIDGDGNTESSSATLTVTEDGGGGGEPPEPPKPPLPPPAQVQAQAVEAAASRGNLTLIQFPQGTLKFYYTEEEGIMKPRLDLSFDVSSLVYYKPISLTYVPWFIYVIAVIMLIIITFAGTTVAENRGEIIDRFRNLRRK